MIAQSFMAPTLASTLLGGLSPAAFMRRHWQKKPLLVRQAVPGGITLVTRAQLFSLAASDQVESRLVVRDGNRWSLRAGPLPRSALPPLKRPGWTLLVQGLDLHMPAARTLLDRFRFVPDARLDDLMISYASDRGGVGPHVDSYDVFLLQGSGCRRWRIGRLTDPALVPNAPLKVLAHFEAEDEWLLEPGDMLYLPPGWAHDGVADGECTTISIGFRAAGRDEIGREVLQQMLDMADPAAGGPRYRDPGQAATAEPGRIPAALQAFATQAARRFAGNRGALECALGEVLSTPKRGVWFDPEAAVEGGRAMGNHAGNHAGIRLDQRTRMLYDDRHVFINGESFRASGRDARAMRRLADQRCLDAKAIEHLSMPAARLLADWLEAGWIHPAPT